MTSIRYQVGGALLQDVSSYVTRDSDRQLFEALKAGEFCYVLNSRQMGKSSLMVRTLAQLQEAGWKGIILDFSAKDTQSDQPSFWYNGIINQLNNHFKLLDRGDFRTWLKERDFISPVERLGEFIEMVLLPGIIEPIIIFVDEIDSTLGLPFTDDFFALIRACYNRRAEKPDYKRLTFALLGVAAPSELIGDTKRTPFNIGKSIDLSGFTLAEAQPLAAGLAEKSENPQAVLEAILYWTGGQPFLSQRLCQLVADANDHITAGSEASFVEGLVRSRLIENWESQDQQSHLKTIRDRVIKNEQKAGYLLELYRQTRQAGSLPVQNRPEEQELQLSGLVVKREGNLQVYNPIYTEVFNESWIDGELAKLRPYAESFRAWVISGKTDKSRLLRGDALEEAEQWAKEKNPSAEDQDFLSESRIQEREEEFAVKKREGELERERQDKEAAEERAKKAEEAKQILAAANDEAKNRLQQAITEGEEKRQQAIHEGEEKRQQAIHEGQKKLKQAISEGEEKRQQAITEGDEKRQQAIDEGQKKRKQITIVGAIILFFALIVAGFFSWKASEQKIEADKQIEIARKATEKARKATEKATQEETKVKGLSNQLESQRIELAKVTNEAVEKQKQADRAKKDAEAADEKAKEAEKVAQKAQGDLTKTQAEKEKLSKEAIHLQEEANRLKGVAKQAEENSRTAKIAEKRANQLKEKAVQAEAKARQAESEVQESLEKTNKALKEIKSLSKLAAELRKKGDIEASNELSTRVTSSVLIEDYELKRIWLLAAKAQANQSLLNLNLDMQEALEGELKGLPELLSRQGGLKLNLLDRQKKLQRELNLNLDEQKELQRDKQELVENFKQSLDSLKKIPSKNNQEIFNQVRVFAYFTAGQLLKNTEYSQSAYDQLKSSKFDLYDSYTINDILIEKDIESIHRNLLNLVQVNSPQQTEIRTSLKNHLLAELDHLMKQGKWQESNEKNSDFLLFIANREEEGETFLTPEDIKELSCNDLNKLDRLWFKNSNGIYGFNVQKEIYLEQGDSLAQNLIIVEYGTAVITGLDKEEWKKFQDTVGWRDGDLQNIGEDIDYNNQKYKNTNKTPKGQLQSPRNIFQVSYGNSSIRSVPYPLFLQRFLDCNRNRKSDDL